MSATAELAIVATPPHAARTIKIGIAGLGQVGQAVSRLALRNAQLQRAGLAVDVVGALVRDPERERRCARPSYLTTSAETFARGAYDVVVEALGAVEPALSIVTATLARGIPVVTANKALVAQHGRQLSALAATSGTAFRYEASALAGVPFLGALGSRPLLSDVRQLTAVVNGTSNFILSAIEAGSTFSEALSQAQSLGLTEPDPSRDLDGLDAADKLSLLAAIIGWGALPSAGLDIQGIRDITSDDLAAAHASGATIKPLVWATLTDAGVSAFIGPTAVPVRHPVAALTGTLSGIQLSGQYISDLFFSGPGAGPDVTAATILDDVVEAVSSSPRRVAATIGGHQDTPPTVTSPDTKWLVRARFPGVVPDSSVAAQMFGAHNLHAEYVAERRGDALWVRLGTASRAQVNAAATALTHTHRVQCRAIRWIA